MDLNVQHYFYNLITQIHRYPSSLKLSRIERSWCEGH